MYAISIPVTARSARGNILRTTQCAFLCLLAMLLARPLKAQETALVTGHPGWAPYTWQHDASLVGIGAELAEIVFKDIGIKAVVKPAGNWARVQSEVANGNIDVIASAYMTDERKQLFVFPAVPYLEDTNVVWVMKGKEFPFKKWDDLIGKKGTALKGESYGAKFDQFIKDKASMQWVDRASANFQNLKSGGADYYPFSVHGGKIQAQRAGLDGKVEHLDEVISKEGVYFAIGKKSRFVKFAPQLEDAIKKRIADGTLTRLEKKYVALAAEEKE